MFVDWCPLSSRLFGYFSVGEKWVGIRKKVDLEEIAGKVTFFSIPPCRSLEDVLKFGLEIGSFC